MIGANLIDNIGMKHHFGGGVYIKEVVVPAGYILVQHKHNHDHLSYLVKGSVELSIDGQISTISAPACLDIKAGIHHGIKALEETIWLCIHATDCEDLEKVDEVLIEPTDGTRMLEMIEELK